ncbi:hypothetical protein DLE04_00960 [Actinobacteria bacterium IMCC26103]|nr:hypothetical protein DLE04_00960 [Actinobacteria bacterium IMCC26103]
MMAGSTLKFSRIRFPWKLRIHCWGGLGSQLFAWAFAEELLNSGFARKITLVLHSSGVTQRNSEITHLSGRIQIKILQDFSASTRTTDSVRSNSSSPRFRGRLISFLSRLQIIIFSEDFQSIKPWTIQLRSHYSHRALSNETLQIVKTTLKNFSTVDNIDTSKSAKTAIHYRLGDLLTLENKTFVSADRVVSALEKIRGLEVREIKNVDVFSDSPEVAVDKLSKQNSSFQYNSVDCPSWDVLVNLLNYPYFIATNSKIGIWVTLLRQLEDSTRVTLVPKELQPTFSFILLKESKKSQIIYY